MAEKLFVNDVAEMVGVAPLVAADDVELAAAELDVALELALDELELDELPQAATPRLAMDASTAIEALLSSKRTVGPPPQEWIDICPHRAPARSSRACIEVVN
jgi:hypothetical protein